jgi:hypothetical protein
MAARELLAAGAGPILAAFEKTARIETAMTGGRS